MPDGMKYFLKGGMGPKSVTGLMGKWGNRESNCK